MASEKLNFTPDEFLKRWLMAMAEAGYPKTAWPPTRPQARSSVTPAVGTMEELQVWAKAAILTGKSGYETEKDWINNYSEKFPDVIKSLLAVP